MGKRSHSLLDPVLDLLVANGNELATTYRWGSNATGYFAVLKRPINFDLVEQTFEFPDGVVLDRRLGEIDYGYGTVNISVE